MIKTHKILLYLIKSALTDTSSQIDGILDHEELFALSKKHQIIPLVFQGLYITYGNFDGSEKFRNATLRLMCHDQNQIGCLSRIEQAFSQNGIDYMLLKGSSIKAMYPASELRLMGDIDILIKEDQYHVIRACLTEMGLREEKETDHELIWKDRSGVLIELHKRLIPSYNDDYYAYFHDPWNKAVLQEFHRFSMTPEDEYIYLLTHLVKHYRDGGIGLKHVIDIWYYSQKHPSLDRKYIRSELEKLELNRFHENLLSMIDVWFCDQPATSLTDYMTERIIESGAYGIRERWDMAHATRECARNESVASAKKQNALSLIFMPYSSMQIKYPLLRIIPVLLPIMWVVRWIDAIMNKRDSILRQSERLRKIDSEVVNNYMQELEMVGLKFSFKKR